MATRKSRAFEREPVVMNGAPAEAATHARSRKRHDAPMRAPAPVAAPTLRLVKPPKSAQGSHAVVSAARGASVMPALASVTAGPAGQLPLRFPPALVALPSALGASVEHRSPSPRRQRVTGSEVSSIPVHSVRQTRTIAKPTVRARFGELREALAEGFEIIQPIFARPLWSVSDDSTTAFNFVLRRELTTRLVTVPEGRTVQRFIRERQLLVDYRC